jgi:hypothetical protein
MGYGTSHGIQFTIQTLEKNSSNVLLCVRLSKFMKVGKLVVVQIMIFVEDENTFSTLTFMKIRLWNCLCEHLVVSQP